METELYSLKEKRVYTKDNAMQVTMGGIRVLTTPSKEILVTRIK